MGMTWYNNNVTLAFYDKHNKASWASFGKLNKAYMSSYDNTTKHMGHNLINNKASWALLDNHTTHHEQLMI